MMLFKQFRSPSVAQVAAALANQLVPDVPSSSSNQSANRERVDRVQLIHGFLSRVDTEARPLRLGIFRKARLASSFKCRLLEKGMPSPIADELTQMLLARLSTPSPEPLPQPEDAPRPANRADAQTLLAQAAEAGSRSAHAEAANYYRQALEIKPRDVVACTNYGVALYQLGRYEDAEDLFRRATAIDQSYVDAQLYLGTVLRGRGRIAESELPLRRAIKLRPQHVNAQVSLGQTLVLLGRLGPASECFEKARRLEPHNALACVGLGQVASLEGRFEEAEAWFKRALENQDAHPAAWAALAGLRKMTSSDADWLKRAEKIAASGVTPLEQADLRFAIGKYWNDLGEYNKAFDSYRRANELQKSAAVPYATAERTRFVDDMIRVYSREALAAPSTGSSDSVRPVFVTGMMRSGTSLVEQIIASHPRAHGAGEMPFWSDVAAQHESALRQQLADESLREKLAARYLQALAGHSADALRVVDKSTFNSDHLGLIHGVFPRARIIYVRRDPIDTCLSCYFHPFSVAHSFTMDLADLAHYYRQHQRLIAHWRAVLPAESLLEVSYAELIADQEKWTRRMLEFLDLDWDERCLQFHLTQRPVITASYWQVRQKLYGTAVGRWRNYRRHIGPLSALLSE